MKRLIFLWYTELSRKYYSLFQHLRFAWGAAASLAEWLMIGFGIKMKRLA